MPIVSSEFKPAWWCQNRHLQSMYSTFLRKPIVIETTKEQFDLPDGDFVDLIWTKKVETGPIVILLHGLEGTIKSPYVSGILKTVVEHDLQGVLMHFRGCSGRHNRLDRSYHSGDTGDIHELITALKRLYPNRDIVVIGVSLGGNALIKYLGEQGKNSLVKAAIAISPPFDLANCAEELKTGASKIYQRYLISSLTKKMRDKFKGRSAPVDLKKLDEWNDFFLFDHNVTAPIHGFESVDDYYTKSSCKQFIKYISTPTLIIHSKDDPFMNETALPTEDEIPESVTLELSEKGGHVGFVYGNMPFNTKYWSEKRIADFFKTKLN